MDTQDFYLKWANTEELSDTQTPPNTRPTLLKQAARLLLSRKTYLVFNREPNNGVSVCLCVCVLETKNHKTIKQKNQSLCKGK